MADTKERDAKLIQYLNEAYGKEKELETALQAHIKMTTRRAVQEAPPGAPEGDQGARPRRSSAAIKQLGGKAEATSVPGPDVASEAAAATAASKAVAAAKGPLHALRGTGEAEKLLKNAKTEFSNEHEEIANYTAIETFAESVGDKETAKLARSIRREEERMAGYLERLIPQLSKAVARAEVPAAQRSTGRRRSTRRTAAKKRATGSGNRRRNTSRSRRRSAGGRSRSRSGSRSS